MFKKLLLGVVVLVVLYAGAVLVEAWVATGHERDVTAQMQRLAKLGDDVKFDDAAAGTTLAESCAKLEHVRAPQLVVYLPKPDDGVSVDDAVKEMFGAPRFYDFRTDEVDRTEFDTDTAARSERGFQHWVMEFASDVPPYWAMYMRYSFRPFGEPLTSAKYLVVRKLSSLRMPRVSGNSYSPGELTFRSAVLDAQTGAVLCQGTSALAQSGTISVYGSGKDKAEAEEKVEAKKESEVINNFLYDAKYFTVREVCWLGGKTACALTFGEEK
jgi:hypothetical protein